LIDIKRNSDNTASHKRKPEEPGENLDSP